MSSIYKNSLGLSLFFTKTLYLPVYVLARYYVKLTLKQYQQKIKDKKLLNTKEIAGSFLYIPSLQKQELLYRLLDKINIEKNKAHIRCDKAYK